jgi:hypothetical protein
MTAADERLLARLGEGTVLTTASMADVVVTQRGNPVVFGIGSFNLTDQPYGVLKDVVLTFFDPGTSEDTRRELVRTWCVQYVVCPDTWVIDAATRTQLRETAWLRLVSEDGDGLLSRSMKINRLVHLPGRGGTVLYATGPGQSSFVFGCSRWRSRRG